MEVKVGDGGGRGVGEGLEEDRQEVPGVSDAPGTSCLWVCDQMSTYQPLFFFLYFFFNSLFSCLCTAYAALIMHISPLWYKLMHSIPFYSTAWEPFSRRSSIFHQLFYCLLS